jgi:hypothetical protein
VLVAGAAEVVLDAVVFWSAVVLLEGAALVVLLAAAFWSPAVVPDGVVAAALWSAVPVELVALLGAGVVAAAAPVPAAAALVPAAPVDEAFSPGVVPVVLAAD